MGTIDRSQGGWHRHTTWIRRFLLPAVILLIAGWLAILGLRDRADQRAEVERFVTTLVADIEAGRDPRVHFALSDPVLVDPVAESIGTLLAGPPFEITVHEGDLDADEAVIQSASHIATFERNGKVAFSLRLIHLGSSDRIAIIGFQRAPAEQDVG